VDSGQRTLHLAARLLRPSFDSRFHCQPKEILIQDLLASLTSLPLFFFQNLCFAASALNSLKSQWTNAPSSWSSASDPCDGGWDGVMCSNGRVTSL
jgi:hypothetical protein